MFTCSKFVTSTLLQEIFKHSQNIDWWVKDVLKEELMLRRKDALKEELMLRMKDVLKE
jgi:hypothetical protein